MIHRRNVFLILIVVAFLCAFSITTASGAGYIIGSPARPVSVSNANPTMVTAASSGIVHAVGGTSLVALFQKVSKANKLNIVWDDTAPGLPWMSVYPVSMKGLSGTDPTAGSWGIFLASQDQYDARTKNFNWNGPAASWAVYVAPVADIDRLVCGAPSDFSPGTVVGNNHDKGTWIILGHWAAGAPPITPPGHSPDNYLAIFVTTGNADVRVETTYPTAWFNALFYPFYSLNWIGSGAPPAYMGNHIGGYAAYIAPPADPLLYMDSNKVKHRHTITGVGRGINYIYVTPDDGTGAPFPFKVRTVKTVVKRGVTATAKVTLK